MARKRERVFALVMVVLFFITSFGFSFLVIWELRSNSNSNNTANTTPINTTPTTKLAGTKIQDFTPTTNIPYLQTKDLIPGTGAAAKSNANVTVNYSGAVAATGIIFQSSYDTGKPATLSLSQVIKGWQLGIPGMKVGGTRELLIPAALAYGANPPAGSNIPANANLVFDVSLVKIN